MRCWANEDEASAAFQGEQRLIPLHEFVAVQEVAAGRCPMAEATMKLASAVDASKAAEIVTGLGFVVASVVAKPASRRPALQLPRLLLGQHMCPSPDGKDGRSSQ